MSMVNPGGSMQLAANMKDSRWLTLEVCREFQRSKCTRSDLECKFAHPPAQVEVQNGRVVCCYDSIKGKCQRREPPCKYLHPPQHLREQLVQNGRNNLVIKNIQMQMLSQSLAVNGQYFPMSGHLINGQAAAAAAAAAAAYQPGYLGAAGPLQIMSAEHHLSMAHQLSMANGGGGGASASGQMKIDSREYGTKRPAVADSKSGIPVYQPSSYQHQQQHQHQQHQHHQHLLAAAAAAAAAAASPYQMASGQSAIGGAYMPTAWNPNAEVLCASPVAWP